MAKKTYIALQAIGLQKVVKPGAEFTIEQADGDPLVDAGLAKPKAAAKASPAKAPSQTDQNATQGGETGQTQATGQGDGDKAASGEQGAKE